MKKLLKVFGVIGITLIVFTAGILYADDSSNQNKYNIKKYDVNVEVTKNNILRVTETIDIYFNEFCSSITRDIQTSGLIYRIGIENSKYNATIYNLKVNEDYTRKDYFGENSHVSLEIKNPNKFEKGEKVYIISYNYYIGEDSFKDFDELYFNIVDSNWNNNIEECTFNISMPKAFDSENISFNSENKNVKDRVNYFVDGNMIKGSIQNLGKNENIAIRCELPQGYFEITNIKNSINYLIISLFIILLIIGIIKWIKNGRNKKIFIESLSTPPEKLNSLEFAFLYRAKADKKDVSSLLFYLANKGYIKIEENVNDYNIIKIKEYDGNNNYEKIFFNELFSNGNKVNTSCLDNKFFRTEERILNSINSKNNVKKILDIKSIKNKNSILNFIFISLILELISFVTNYAEALKILLQILPFILILITLYIMSHVIERLKNNDTFKKIFALMYFMMIFIIIYSTNINNYHFNLLGYATLVIGMITTISLLILKRTMTSRTKYGSQIFAQIKGYKRFLDNVKVEQLEQIIKEQPTYYYDNLAYMYALEISKKCTEKFEKLNIQPPSWYVSKGNFKLSYFNLGMEKIISSLSK